MHKINYSMSPATYARTSSRWTRTWMSRYKTAGQTYLYYVVGASLRTHS